MIWTIYIICLLISTFPSPSEQISCKDESGAGVDWWVLYKLPARDRKQPSHLDQGVAYVYSTSITAHKGWTLSDLSIEDPSSLPGQTLQPLYGNNNQDLYHVMYNDEHPDGNTSFTAGHTKGVVFGDSENTVWLIHSVPHYPPKPEDGYGYPHSGHLYGQSYLCLSLPTETANVLGTQLTYNRPYIYSTAIPDWLTDYPAMIQALEGKHIHVAPFFHAATIQTRAGKRITTFAKYTTFGKDLYSDLVAPMLAVPLLVETWPNGPGRMNSSCRPPFIVENVSEMDFPNVSNEDFTTRHDHAKWAISLDVKKPYVCVGDINRMETQRRRAGGTACFIHKRMWKTFKMAIKAVETCPRPYK